MYNKKAYRRAYARMIRVTLIKQFLMGLAMLVACAFLYFFCIHGCANPYEDNGGGALVIFVPASIILMVRALTGHIDIMVSEKDWVEPSMFMEDDYDE